MYCGSLVLDVVFVVSRGMYALSALFLQPITDFVEHDEFLWRWIRTIAYDANFLHRLTAQMNAIRADART
jgi:hypothetical protein